MRVLSLLVDRMGFLWAGTRKGVARFDGSRFMTWSHSTHEVFASEECIALAEHPDGTLWVGTGGGLIHLAQPPALYNLGGHQVAPSASPEGPRNRIRRVLITGTGEVLVATEGGLARQPWQRPASDQAPLGGLCTSMEASPDGTIWAGTSNQLFRRNAAEGAWKPEFPDSADGSAQFVHALAVTPDGSVFAIVGSWQLQSGRLLQQDASGWRPVCDLVLRNYGQPIFLAADRRGDLWFPVTGQVVGCWRDGRLHEYALPLWMREDVFRCLVEDAEGNLWAGTSRNGLLCLQPRRIQTLTTSDGLPDAKARAVIKAADGALWIGTDGGVVRWGDGESQVLNQASGLPSDKIRALAEDEQGRLWIGTGVGLSTWDGRTVAPEVYDGPEHRTKIRTLYATRDGSVWAGTAQGLYRFGWDQNRAWQVADGLPHENVCALLEDRRGRVWIGMDGGGLARLTDQGFERFDVARGLSSPRVWALHEDDEGALWIGTDRGLNVLRDERISVITTAHGLPDNLVNSVIEDDRGWIWVGHDRGIYRVARQELLAAAEGRLGRVRCIEYAEEDGLLNPETNGQISGPPVIRLRDGRVAFATMGGVAIFNPDYLPDLTNGPPAHIEELRGNGQVLYAGQPGKALRPSARQASGRLSIAPLQRGFVEV